MRNINRNKRQKNTTQVVKEILKIIQIFTEGKFQSENIYNITKAD